MHAQRIILLHDCMRHVPAQSRDCGVRHQSCVYETIRVGVSGAESFILQLDTVVAIEINNTSNYATVSRHEHNSSILLVRICHSFCYARYWGVSMCVIGLYFK